MKSLKILMIGNSFSICAGKYLPDIVLSAGHSMKLVSAYIGGCSLKKHADNLVQSEKDAAFRPYRHDVWYIAGGRVIHDNPPDESLNRILKDDAYDIVTIQQASSDSWNFDTYEPCAGQLIEQVRRNQPGAEIVIQQTWSYNAQHPFFGGTWNFDQTGMYRRLDDAYRKLAEKYGFRRIPTGTAVQISREKTPPAQRYRPYPQESAPSFRWPDLPSVAGDVVGNIAWHQNPDGQMVIIHDAIHLNPRGEYLQACVWYGALFGGDPRRISGIAPQIDNTDAVFLRGCAAGALIAEDDSCGKELQDFFPEHAGK